MNGRAIATLAVTMLAIFAGAPARGGIAAIGEENEDASPVAPRAERLAAIARLPHKVRTLVLESAVHPDLLEAFSDLQANTNRRMSELAANLPDRHRQPVWLLLAHSDLVAAMAAEATAPAVFLEQITSHPEPVAEAARTLLLENPELVREIFELQSEASGQYESLLTHHVLATQITFLRLLEEPQALSLVMVERSLLQSLGVLYRHDSDATDRALDRIAKATIAEHAGALPGWEATREVEVVTDPNPTGKAEPVALMDVVERVEGVPLDDVAGTKALAGFPSRVAPVRSLPVSLMLGDCASKPIRPAKRRPRSVAALGGRRQWVFSTGESAARARAPRPGEGGGSVLVWPKPGNLKTRPAATARSQIRSIPISRHPRPRTSVSRHIAEAPRKSLEPPTRVRNIRSHLARPDRRSSSHLASPQGRSSMKSSRSKMSRSAGPSRGRRGRH